MEFKQPQVVVIGGPNGAGKTTIASEMIQRDFGILHFVNADIIARGLSMFDPDRVAERVSHGGHFVPDETVRRRYAACFRNFFSLYLPIATTWQLLDNSGSSGVKTIAKGVAGREPVVLMSEIWSRIKSEFCHDD